MKIHIDLGSFKLEMDTTTPSGREMSGVEFTQKVYELTGIPPGLQAYSRALPEAPSSRGYVTVAPDAFRLDSGRFAADSLKAQGYPHEATVSLALNPVTQGKWHPALPKEPWQVAAYTAQIDAYRAWLAATPDVVREGTVAPTGEQVVSTDGKTALHFAVQGLGISQRVWNGIATGTGVRAMELEKAKELMAEIVRAGVDVNAQDAQGHTALYYACLPGFGADYLTARTNIDVIKFLEGLGCRLTPKEMREVVSDIGNNRAAGNLHEIYKHFSQQLKALRTTESGAESSAAMVKAPVLSTPRVSVAAAEASSGAALAEEAAKPVPEKTKSRPK